MSEELSTELVDLSNLSALDIGTDEVVSPEVLAQTEAIMTSSAFLPRLQLNASTSKLVTSGQMPVGIFALVYNQTKFVNLGKEVVFVALTFRPKAFLMPKEGSPVSYFDQTTPEFQKVAAKAMEKGMNGNMVGPEFLIWIPSENTFATFYHSSETLRRVAPSVLQIMRKDPNDPNSKLQMAAVRGKMKFIAPKGSTFQWWGYEAFAESSPLSPAPAWFSTALPEEIQKFKNPPKSEVEPAPEAAAGSERAR